MSGSTRHRPSSRRIGWLLIIASIGTVPVVVRANPSHLDPHAAMALHDLVGAKEIMSAASGICANAHKTMEGIIASQGKAGLRQFSDAHLALRRLRRAALDLQIQGETAGADFGLRADTMLQQWNQAMTAFKANPANTSQIAKIRQNLPAQHKKATFAIQNAQKLMREQQAVKAYLYLEGIFDEITFYGVFLSPQESEALLGDYIRLIGEIAPMRHRQLRGQIQERLEAIGAPLVPDLQALLATMAAAASTLQSAGTFDVNGQSLNGPQCLDHFLQQWQEIHLKALRCRAIDWARRLTIPRLSYLPTPTLPNRVDDDQYRVFCEQIIPSLAAIVAAEAQRANAVEAPQLYMQYLDVLAPMLPRLADDPFETAIDAALNQLVAKSPELINQVNAYRSATDELLRWRERVAAEEAAAQDGQFSASRQVLERAFASRDDYRGLFTAERSTLDDAQLLGSCPEVLSGATDQIVERSIRVGDVAALQGGQTGVARYDHRHYATMPLPPIAEAVALLKRDLLVGDSSPPLSLAAAIAIASAHQANYQAVGGAVQNVYLEGLVPRFAVLPSAALPMMRLGPLHSVGNDALLLNHVVVRLHLMPTWIHHRYFFAQMPQPDRDAGSD
jgi:hypothetical protein